VTPSEESFYDSDEPIRGLPALLPAGEEILWQGEPAWRLLAVRMFQLRKLAIYFGLLIAVDAVSLWRAGGPVADAAMAFAEICGLATFVLGFICLFCYLVSRTTVYTITNRRVVIRAGIALSKTINLPFTRLESAALRPFGDGGGDILLTPMAEDHIAYMVLWPHAQAWQLSHARPMLRAVPGAVTVATILGAALAADGQGAAVPAASPRSGNARPVGGRAAVAA